MAVHGYEPPRPLPANADAWFAFWSLGMSAYRVVLFDGQRYMPRWSDIQPVLELYGLWRMDVHGKLSLCFAILMKMEAKRREAMNG